MPFDGPHSAWPRHPAGIDPDGSSDYVSFTGPPIPASPWSLGFLYRCDSNSGSSLQYIVNVRNFPFSATPGFTIYWGDNGSVVGSNWNWDYIGEGGSTFTGGDNFWSAPLPADGGTRLIVAGRDWNSNFTARTMRAGGPLHTQSTFANRTDITGVNAGTWIISGRVDFNAARFSRNPIGNFFFVHKYLSRADIAVLANGGSIRDVVPKSKVIVDMPLIRPPSQTALRHPDFSGRRFHGTVANSGTNAAQTRSFRRRWAPLWVPPVVFEGGAPADIEGDLDATDAADTASMSGAVLVQGDLDATEAQDTAALAGAVLVQGDVDATEAPDVAEFLGQVDIEGFLDAMEAQDSASMSGAVLVQGDMDATEPADVAAFIGAGVVVESGPPSRNPMLASVGRLMNR